MSVVGMNPLLGYKELFYSGFGNVHALLETISKMIPLTLCALGINLAFRSGFWNIGAEGQLYMGAIGAAFIAFTLSNLPSILLLPCMIAFGFLLGGVWCMIPGVLKYKLGVDEILTTLLLNYIAILFNLYLVYGPWRDPHSMSAITALFPVAAWMPVIPGTRVHLTWFLIPVLVTLCYLSFFRTKKGFELRVMGSNLHAAKYAGINIFRAAILVTFISGGICGIAGVGEVSGIYKILFAGISPGFGFTAIMICWFAKENFFAIPLVAFLLGGLINGGYGLQMEFGVPVAFVNTLQALILICMLTFEFLYLYEIKIEGGRKQWKISL